MDLPKNIPSPSQHPPGVPCAGRPQCILGYMYIMTEQMKHDHTEREERENEKNKMSERMRERERKKRGERKRQRMWARKREQKRQRAGTVRTQ